MPITQANREIEAITPLGKDVLLFRSMTGTEELGRMPEYHVQLLSVKKDIQIADILGQSLALRVDLPGGGERWFNGVVTRFCCTGAHGNFASYEATVHPWLWLLTRSSDCRIFQDKSVTDIIKEVCSADKYGGVVEIDFGQLTQNHEPLGYCVQYRESDFNFVCRLLEQEGIYFFFRHEEKRHTMVLADSYSAHCDIPGYGALPFRGDASRERLGKECVHQWQAGGQIQASTFVLNDFDFERTAASTGGGLKIGKSIPAAFSQPSYEQFDYPGGYTRAARGGMLASARIETLHGQCEEFRAVTSARGLFPGGIFGMVDHPRADQNRKFLVTSARYQLEVDDYETSGAAGGGAVFQCVLGAVGKERSFRPVPSTPKPCVHGPQTAMVVGKAGEEIWTDKYGRIKVQFHWDREGKEDEKSSCWVRVAQSWSGKRWGSMFIPRIGMEVVVEFLEGDPDRPLVTGCVYNSSTMPPYDLPAEQTKSTIKSESSKGGGGFNEIRFEDKKGAEEVYMHAERDSNRVVKNNDTLKVGFGTAAPGDQKVSIKNCQSLSVGASQSESVGANQTVSVGKDQSVHVKENQTLKVDMDQSVKVGMASITEAGTSIELKVGASSIKIEPGKITISSPQIAIEGDATVDVKAGAMLTLQGALVKIN